jgi:hypothetical protein
MPATPGPFRLNQNPLGAYHLPQAPTSVALTRYRGALPKAQEEVCFHPLAPIPAHPHSASRRPELDVSRAALLVVANALATWRQD